MHDRQLAGGRGAVPADAAAAALGRRPEFVQAIKIAQDEVGLRGGPVRLPRLALPKDEADEVRAALRAYGAALA